MMRPLVLLSREISAPGVFRVRPVHQTCPAVTGTTAYYSSETENIDSLEEIMLIKRKVLFRRNAQIGRNAQHRRTTRAKEYIINFLELNTTAKSRLAEQIKESPVASETLLNIAEMLKESGHEGKDFCSKLFEYPFLELEQKLVYLKEAGVTAELNNLLGFEILFKQPTFMLRAGRVLPDVKNYSEELLSQVGCDVPLVEKINERSSYKHVHLKTVLHYIEWFLDVRLSMSHIRRIQHFVPIHHVAKNLKFLSQLKVQREKILAHLKVLNASPTNVEAVMKCGCRGLHMSELLCSSPHLLLENPHTLQERLLIFQERGISGKEILDNPQVLKKERNLVDKIIPSLRSMPHLKDGELVKTLSYKFPQHHLAFKVKPKVKHDVPFDEHLNQSKLRSKLPQYLAEKFGMSISDVKEQLSYYPQWFHSDPKTILDTENYLIGLGYSKDDIGKSIILLLHERTIVEDTLCKYVYTDPGIKKTISEVNNRHLALCLYYIEKKHQFVGAVIDSLED